MKIVMTLLVRDEADIIAANLDFHLAQGVDFFIVTDNLSCDGTTEILHGYAKRGLLRYLHEPDDTYAQHRWVSRMARMAADEYAADWVINNDADEFWWPEAGNLKTTLGAVPATVDCLIVTRTNYLPRAFDEEGFFADTMIVRESESLNAVGKPLPPKICHRAYSDIDITQGNHSASRHSAQLRCIPGNLSIHHFPMRSYRQFANKIAKGGAAYSRNVQLPPNVGATWRHLFELWQRGELPAYFHSCIPEPQDLAAGLASGKLLIDDRLKRFFERMK